MPSKLFLSNSDSNSSIKYCFVDEEFHPIILESGYKWSYNPIIRYVYANTPDGTLYLHKFILKHVYPDSKDWFDKNGDKLCCDHINRDRLDNTIDNLRLVTRVQSQDNRNIFINNTSGHTGIEYIKDRKLYKASITIMYKAITLGRFKSLEEALLIRNFASEIKSQFLSMSEQRAEREDKDKLKSEIILYIKNIREKFKNSRNRERRILIERRKLESFIKSYSSDISSDVESERSERRAKREELQSDEQNEK